MIGGITQLAAAVWDFLGRMLKAFATWLRKPRDWWRFIAGVLALGCLFSAWAVHDAKQQVLIVREQCNSELVLVRGAAGEATTTAKANAQALNVCRLQLEDEVGKRQRIEQLGRDAVKAAERDAAAARSDLADWQRNYRKRPATCEAALQALEASCPSITTY